MTEAEINGEAAIYLARPATWRRRVTFADFLVARRWDFRPTDMIELTEQKGDEE